MKLEKLICRQEPFKKGSIIGYVSKFYNYCVSVSKILILQLSKSGLVLWFDNNYHSKFISKVQNIICKMLKIPIKRDTFANYKIPKEKWRGTNILNLPKIKEKKNEQTEQDPK